MSYDPWCPHGDEPIEGVTHGDEIMFDKPAGFDGDYVRCGVCGSMAPIEPGPELEAGYGPADYVAAHTYDVTLLATNVDLAKIVRNSARQFDAAMTVMLWLRMPWSDAADEVTVAPMDGGRFRLHYIGPDSYRPDGSARPTLVSFPEDEQVSTDTVLEYLPVGRMAHPADQRRVASLLAQFLTVVATGNVRDPDPPPQTKETDGTD